MEKEFIEFKNTNKVFNDRNCLVYEYLFGSEKTGFALIEIKKRYPEKGIVRNKVFEEIIFILEGSGKLVVDNKKYNLKKNDAALIKPNKNIIMKVI